MTNIVTATGKEFKSDYMTIHRPSNTMYLRILDEEQETVRTVFDDENETKTLTYAGNTYEGYTNLERIKDDGDAWKVSLVHE